MTPTLIETHGYEKRAKLRALRASVDEEIINCIRFPKYLFELFNKIKRRGQTKFVFKLINKLQQSLYFSGISLEREYLSNRIFNNNKY